MNPIGWWGIGLGCLGALAFVVIGFPLLGIGVFVASGVKDCWEAADGRDLANLPEAALVPPHSELAGPPSMENESCGAFVVLRTPAVFEQKYRSAASDEELHDFFFSRIGAPWVLEGNRFGWTWGRPNERLSVEIVGSDVTVSLSRGGSSGGARRRID